MVDGLYEGGPPLSDLLQRLLEPRVGPVLHHLLPRGLRTCAQATGKTNEHHAGQGGGRGGRAINRWVGGAKKGVYIYIYIYSTTEEETLIYIFKALQRQNDV